MLQVAAFRKRLEKVVGDKHEEVMGRMGAIMATGPATALLLENGCAPLPWHSSAGHSVPWHGAVVNVWPCVLGALAAHMHIVL